MDTSLVIVESPTKIKTIKKYLGPKYQVDATLGHIKDLPKKKIGVDIKNNFQPSYITIPGKNKIIKNLKKSAKNIMEIYLAPDPDREGEAIAWHTAEILKQKNRKFHRVLFNELTKKAIINAIENPKKLNKNKYKAQQARRILDRLVGYEISSLLWAKVKRGISAGRVQSVSVRIICEREKKIRTHKTIEYWSINATLQNKESKNFNSKLIRKNNKKKIILNEKAALKIKQELLLSKFIVHNITEKIKRITPQPPFTTSKLQQEAINKLKFSAKKTMLIAQQLYEGIEIRPNEAIGLITYMRTDSIKIAEEASKEALKFISETFGSKFALKKPRIFQNKKKSQNAHEAIRPTSVYNFPEKIKKYLSKEQFVLYQIIWQRFLASQMEKAIYCYNTIKIKANKYTFNTGGSIVKFPGFNIIYTTSVYNKYKTKESLPILTLKEKLKFKKTKTKQHFTKPPSRFSEASLVKELEENGIGRPSTYASILSNIRDKGYVDFFQKHYKPTELGFIVNNLLIEVFPEIIDVEFTAKMEAELDKVEQAEINSTEVLNNFYTKFSKKLNTAKDSLLSIKGLGIATNIKCPICNKKQLKIKMGKNGHFIACSRYPECTYSSNYERDIKGNINLNHSSKGEMTNKVCSICNKAMVIKNGKYGKFLACSGFPKCKNTISTKYNETKISCPKSQCYGHILERYSKRGKLFYSCNTFPKCNFASWYKPINKNCPKCDSKYLIEKIKKNKKKFFLCPSTKCNYTEI